MSSPLKRIVPLAVIICALAVSASGDEIRLKNGKKLYGVIVAFEDNMYKVKTDFGYVLVQKDKIADIVPNASPASAPAAAKPAKKTEPPFASAPETTKQEEAAEEAKPSTASAKRAPLRKEAPKPGEVAEQAAATQPTTAAAAPKSPEPPVSRDAVQGNEYVNFTYGFRMYKPPGWELIEDARNALPNAIVAMGTNDENTLLVVGREKMNQPLDFAAPAIEKRLSDIYENYQLASQRKTVISGLPGIQYKFRGRADEHDWSGTLVVLSRGNETYTLLGMTHADTDLIQIQENVIARAIASANFSAQ
jgi:hypothetical protein